MCVAFVGFAAAAVAQDGAPALAQRIAALNDAYFEIFADAAPEQTYETYFAPSLKAQVTLDQWSGILDRDRAVFKAVEDWRFHKTTWYGPEVTKAGWAAELDFVGATAEQRPGDRYSRRYVCGFIVWAEQGPDDFAIIRQEFNVFDPEQVKSASIAQVNALLAQLRCPFRQN